LVTKDELCDRICEILGVDIDSLTRMTKEDLELLLEVLDNPTRLIQIGVKRLRIKTKKELLERPIKDLLNRSFIDEILGEQEDKGPLGFGILPTLFGRSTSKREEPH